MTSCACPGCPSTGTHEHNGKLYCEVHLPKPLLVIGQSALRWMLDNLPRIASVNVEGRKS